MYDWYWSAWQRSVWNVLILKRTTTLINPSRPHFGLNNGARLRSDLWLNHEQYFEPTWLMWYLWISAYDSLVKYKSFHNSCTKCILTLIYIFWIYVAFCNLSINRIYIFPVGLAVHIFQCQFFSCWYKYFLEKKPFETAFVSKDGHAAIKLIDKGRCKEMMLGHKPHDFGTSPTHHSQILNIVTQSCSRC